MKSIPISRARKHLTRIVNQAANCGERIVISRRGKVVAALIPLGDLELLHSRENRKDLNDARAAMAEARRRGTVPWHKLKAEASL